MASYFQPLIVLFALVSCGLTASIREKRQAGGFLCPQPNGLFEFPGDCTRYYSCDEGVSAIRTCGSQLIFNPQQGRCDWPFRSPNPTCNPRGGAILNLDLQGICDINPYPDQPQNAFLRAHPSMCNAFYTCSTSFLYAAPCSFCGEGMYFNEEVGQCREIRGAGRTLEDLCNGKLIVDHGNKVFAQIDGSCWPYADRPNPWQEAAILLASGTGLPGGPGAPLPTQGGAPPGF